MTEIKQLSPKEEADRIIKLFSVDSALAICPDENDPHNPFIMKCELLVNGAEKLALNHVDRMIESLTSRINRLERVKQEINNN